MAHESKHPSWIRVPRRAGAVIKAIPREEVYQCLVELRRGLRAGRRRDLLDAALEWLNDGTIRTVLYRPASEAEQRGLSFWDAKPPAKCVLPHEPSLVGGLDKPAEACEDEAPWPNDDDFRPGDDDAAVSAAGGR